MPTSDPRMQPPNSGSVPNPDPTIRTVEQLTRDILASREIVEGKITNVHDVLEARMTSMDKAVLLLQDFANRSPTISEVVAKFDEKFHTIDTQITERDTVRDTTARETKVAVDAALSAQEKQAAAMSKTITEAIDKSERQVTKEVDSLKAALEQSRTSLDEKIDLVSKTLDDKINDNKIRIGSMEARGNAYSQGFGWIISGVGVIAAVAGAVAAVFFKNGG